METAKRTETDERNTAVSPNNTATPSQQDALSKYWPYTKDQFLEILCRVAVAMLVYVLKTVVVWVSLNLGPLRKICDKKFSVLNALALVITVEALF
jgi:hypothetical protein